MDHIPWISAAFSAEDGPNGAESDVAELIKAEFCEGVLSFCPVSFTVFWQREDPVNNMQANRKMNILNSEPPLSCFDQPHITSQRALGLASTVNKLFTTKNFDLD
jgi:hypothetical protein